MNPEAWRVIAKVDPDKPLLPEHIATLATSGVDAVVLGGTQNITRDKVAVALAALQPTRLPLALEVSTAEAVLPTAAHFLIPVVLNTRDATWLTGAHQAVAHALRGRLDWSRVTGEGYIILNPNSAVAAVTGARTDLSPEEAAAYAEVGAHVLRLPWIYVEYSGRFGDPAVVAACRRALQGTGSRLIYGGGITTPEQAAAMAALADLVVIGNLVQGQDHHRLPEIVRSVKAMAL